MGVRVCVWDKCRSPRVFMQWSSYPYYVGGVGNGGADLKQ